MPVTCSPVEKSTMLLEFNESRGEEVPPPPPPPMVLEKLVGVMKAWAGRTVGAGLYPPRGSSLSVPSARAVCSSSWEVIKGATQGGEKGVCALDAPPPLLGPGTPAKSCHRPPLHSSTP